MSSATINSKTVPSNKSKLTKKYLSLSTSSLFPGASGKLELKPDSLVAEQEEGRKGVTRTGNRTDRSTVAGHRGVTREGTFKIGGKTAEDRRNRSKTASADKSAVISGRGKAEHSNGADEGEEHEEDSNGSDQSILHDDRVQKLQYTQKNSKSTIERRATKGKADLVQAKDSKARLRQRSQPDLVDPALLNSDLKKGNSFLRGLADERGSSVERPSGVNLRSKKSGAGADDSGDSRAWRMSGTISRWFRHITDATDTRTKEPAKASRKSSATLSSNGTPAGSSASGAVTRETGSRDSTERIHGNGDEVVTSQEDRAFPDEAGPDRSVESSQRSDLEDRGEMSPRSRGGSMNSLEAVDSVEILHIEQPHLVQPSEVVVSSAVCVEQLNTAVGVRQQMQQQPQQLGSSSAPVETLLDALREKNRQIEETMREKQNLTANILQIPVNDYINIADMVAESGEATRDVKELLLGSLTQVDLLTQLINERLSPEPESKTDGAQMAPHTGRTQNDEDCNTENDDDGLPTPTPEGSATSLRSSDLPLADPGGPRNSSPQATCPRVEDGTQRLGVSSSMPIVMSSAQLRRISLNLHRQLTRLMEVIVKRDEERAHLQTEFSRIQNQITSALREATSKGSQINLGPGRPAGKRPPPPAVALAAVAENSPAGEVHQSASKGPSGAELPGRIAVGSRPQSGKSEGGVQSEDDWSSRPSSWMSAGSSSEGVLDAGDETDHSGTEPSATLVTVPIVMERLEVVESASLQNVNNIGGSETDYNRKEVGDNTSDDDGQDV